MEGAEEGEIGFGVEVWEFSYGAVGGRLAALFALTDPGGRSPIRDCPVGHPCRFASVLMR